MSLCCGSVSLSCEIQDWNSRVFCPCRHLKPELSHFEHVIVVEYLGFLLSRFPVVVLLSSTVELYLIWVVIVSIQNWKGERSNVVHVCGMRLRFRSTADWVWGGALIVRTVRILTDTCSRTAGFRSLCCTQGGNARCRTNLDRIDPVRASGLHQLWHEVGVERASLWVFECSVSRVATSF